MFVEAIYNYTLVSPVGEFISRTILGYRSCGMAD